MKKENKDFWEKQLDERIENFANEILETIREQIRPDLRNTKKHKKTCTSCADDRAYNQTLSEVLKIIKEIKKLK